MTYKETRRLIRSDYTRYLRHYGMKSNVKNFLNIFFTHSMTATTLYRLSHYLFVKNRKFLSRFFYLLNITLTGAEILPDTVIGEGLNIFHTVGTTLGGRIGKNCTIWGQAGIGSDPLKNNDVGAGIGFALVGDDVGVGYGAKILGPIIIGNGVIVGAASLVIDSIPDNAVVAGVPAKILRYKNDK